MGVAPLPGSTTMSHSAESLGRAALNDRPDFTVALQQIHTRSPVSAKHDFFSHTYAEHIVFRKLGTLNTRNTKM